MLPQSHDRRVPLNPMRLDTSVLGVLIVEGKALLSLVRREYEIERRGKFAEQAAIPTPNGNGGGQASHG